jgi:rhamnosyltransferase subunit B
MSKRILFVTLGTLGDVNPYIAIGRVLQADGHHVTIAALPRHADAIGRSGLAFAAAQPDDRAGTPEDPLSRVFAEPGNAMRLLARGLVLDQLGESIAAATPLVASHDLTVLHPAALGARLAAETLGRPWLSTILSPVGLASRLAPPRTIMPIALQGASDEARSAFFQDLTTPWHTHRQRLGLPDLLASRALDGPNGMLALFSRHFAPNPGDWPAAVRITGFCSYDSPADAPERERLTAFLAAGPPPLVATLGAQSELVGRHFFPATRVVARQLGLRLLVIGGTAETLGLEPGPDLACFRVLPFSQVFPHAAAIVAHAGIGTTAQALSAGVPFLAVALPFHDGPDNARRVRHLGVGDGIVLQQRDLTGPLGRLSDILGQPQYAAAARRLAAALAGEDGATAAATQILRCI